MTWWRRAPRKPEPAPVARRCYLHYSRPMPLSARGPCICECDHESGRSKYLDVLESMSPDEVLQKRINELRGME